MMLVCIQAYLWLHLGHLTSLIEAHSIAPSFPWIGAYPTLVAKGATLVSTGLFPLGVVAWLAIDTWAQIGSVLVICLCAAYALVQALLIFQLLSFWQALERAREPVFDRKRFGVRRLAQFPKR